MSLTEHAGFGSLLRARVAMLTLTIVLALALAGCSTTRASATLIPSTTPEPVAVALTLAQQGTVEKHTLKLLATIAVTNRQSETIAILQVPTYPPIRIDVSSIYGTKLFTNNISDTSYFDELRDAATVAPGGTQTWTQTLDVSHTGGFLTGVTFVAIASVDWHIGPVDSAGEPTGPHDTATGQAQITLT